MPCTPPWIWRRSIWNWPETAGEPLPAKPRRTAAACKPTENTSDKKATRDGSFSFCPGWPSVWKRLGAGALVLRAEQPASSRQSTSPRPEQTIFPHKILSFQGCRQRFSPPIIAVSQGTATAGGWECRQAPPDHSGPGRTPTARRLAMPSGNCLTQRQDLWKIPTLILSDCFTLSVQEISSITKKAPQKIPAEPFLSLFLAQRIRRNPTARLLSPSGTRLHTSGRSTGWTGFPGHAPPSGRQGSPPHQTAPPCGTG